MADQKNQQHFVLTNGGGYQGWRLIGLPGRTGPRSENEFSYMAPMADLLDRMHGRARQGAELDAMCQAFPSLDRVDLADWMAANQYPRRGDGKG